jgi:predicted small lipoprotein YifL|tara:strand:+ start:264 stop:383 length:120 start_codon:yes stop_codon:yes gene_type:complete
MKKTVIIIMCFIFLFSCGRKGSPEFKDEEGNITKFKKPE